MNQYWRLNPDLPKDIKFKSSPLDYVIPEWDCKFKHVWYIDPLYHNEIDDKIWAYECVTELYDNSGYKEIGNIIPDIKGIPADVVFISYNEPNAEQNWRRVLEKAPTAKRVHGVDGIFEAHKAAAFIADTELFYVVDGDAYLTDDWEFDFLPSIFDKDCTYIFNSINPVNGLEYGYGGVKLFPKLEIMYATSWGTDITTSIATNIKVIKRVSNITNFNTDEFSTWRSAFRECAKLASNSINNSNEDESSYYLKSWLNVGVDKPFGQYALDGARAGFEYGIINRANKQSMDNINNYNWLKDKFNNYEQRI